MENNESVIILVVVGIAFVLLFGGYYLISKKRGTWETDPSAAELPTDNYAGGHVADATDSPKERPSTPEDKLSGKIGLRWHKVYRVLLPIALLLFPLSYGGMLCNTVSYFYDNNLAEYFTDPLLGPYSTVTFIFSIVAYVLVFWEWLCLKRYKKHFLVVMSAWYATNLIGSLLPLLLISNLELRAVAFSEAWPSIIPTTIFFVLNLFYYWRRIELFY